MCSASRARNPVGAEVAQHHPQFQCAEPATELDAGIHQVARDAGLGRFQILGRERERRTQTSMCRV